MYKLLLNALSVLLCVAFQISDAFKKFGMGDKDTDILVVEIAEKDKSTMDSITQAVEGETRSMDELKDVMDIALIKKLYKVTEEELTIGSLDEAVVCRIASKDFVSF